MHYNKSCYINRKNLPQNQKKPTQRLTRNLSFIANDQSPSAAEKTQFFRGSETAHHPDTKTNPSATTTRSRHPPTPKGRTRRRP